MTIIVVCGLNDVQTTGKTQYTYVVGEVGFSLEPVSFEQFPACGYSATIVGTSLPSFITLTTDPDSPMTALLDLAQFDDNAMEGDYTFQLDFEAPQDSPFPPFTKSVTITITVLKNCGA